LGGGNPGAGFHAHAPSTSSDLGFSRYFTLVLVAGPQRPEFCNLLIYSDALLFVSVDRGIDDFVS
jgi:hypothetical protein